MKSYALPVAALASALAVALPAHAIEDDRFTLRLSAVRADTQSVLEGRTQFMGEEYRFKEDFDFGSDELAPRIDAQWRLGDRHRLVLHYFDYDKRQRATLDEAISFDDITIPAGSFAESEVRFRLATVAYDFAVVETPTVSLGLQLGVQYARLSGSIYAEAGSESYSDRGDEDGYLPTVGARLGFAPGGPWRVQIEAQHLDTDWGDLEDTTGTLSRAQALVEYRVNERLGVHAGYDWNRLDIRDEGDDGIVGLDQRFRGPMAGVTLAF